MVVSTQSAGAAPHMYTEYFGLHEKPFELSPDPRYLFLSASHREALGHLIYGIEQREGFIAIIGEVGTGKTTLCRTLIQRLGNDCEVAFLFNPHLSPLELLKAINAEFGLSTFGHSMPELLEVLNEFLLDKKAQDRNVLLLVDEAQTLSTETLEQMRLLSNLETRTAKLLQIVLLGQPELGEKLESHELRQLRQRIAVRRHLGPLTAAETRDYVHHRLRIAAGGECRVFTDAALGVIHRASGGVPRLINVLCDRALLAAYGENAHQIGRSLAGRVAREVWPRRRAAGRGLRRTAWVALATGLALAGFVAGIHWAGRSSFFREADVAAARAVPEDVSLSAVAAAPPSASAPAPRTEAPAFPPPQEVAALPPPATSAPQVLDALLPLRTREAANAAVFAATLAAWQLPAGDIAKLTRSELLDALAANDMLTLRVPEGNIAGLRHINLPAILQLRVEEGGTRTALVRRIDADAVYLRGVIPGETVRATVDEVEARWTGDAIVVWRDYAGLPHIVDAGDEGPHVEWLQRALARAGYYLADPNGSFDAETLSAVRAFQAASGIAADGRVGPMTKIRIYQNLGEQIIPALLAQPHPSG
jgi:general secretion pathway protein A